MSKLSIRWRLTLWNTLAVAALLIVCGLLVYGMLRQAMYKQLDQLLASQFDELRQDRLMAADHERRIAHWIQEFKAHVNVFAVVYDSRGQVFARTGELAEESVPSNPNCQPAEPRLGTQQLAIIGQQRTLTARLSAGGEEFTVVLMAPLADVEANLARVRTVLITALPVSLVLAGAIGYWLSRKALAPIERLRGQTDKITAERLDRRLPIDNPDDELGRLAQTINQMISRLERSFAEIRRFTADASHELRTPLAVLRIEVEVAMGKSLDENAQRNLLASVLEECQRLTSLTDQLLTLSRDDAGMTQYASEGIDLSSLVAAVVETMTPLAEAKQQTLTFRGSENACITGDAGRLRQVFYNLLDNAVKFTPHQGRIEVSVVGCDNTINVAVRDTGIGIPSEHLPRVFDRFYRVDKARSRDEGGTGLGLSIVQTIVVAHGGTVEISSEPDHGTTCIVTLSRADY